jgi:ABC-type amino acid transport substrate-binding protein
MAKILTVALVVIMLVVGFVVGLFSAPTLMPYKPATPEASPTPAGSSTPAPTAATDTVWANIQATHKLVIGTDATWPPYQQRNNVTGEIEGFEVDLANAVASKLGLTPEWHDVGFDSIIISVQDKSFDMGVSGFSVTPARLEEVSFTLPHSTTEGQIIMLQSTMQAKNITTLSTLADFKTQGITVGVQSGNVQEEELRAAGVDIQVWQDSAQPFLDMVSGNPSVQAVYAETPITTNWINTFASQGKTASVVYSHPYYPVAFLVNKSSLTLLDKVDGALATLIHDGVVNQLKAKWQIPLA